MDKVWPQHQQRLEMALLEEAEHARKTSEEAVNALQRKRSVFRDSPFFAKRGSLTGVVMQQVPSRKFPSLFHFSCLLDLLRMKSDLIVDSVGVAAVGFVAISVWFVPLVWTRETLCPKVDGPNSGEALFEWSVICESYPHNSWFSWTSSGSYTFTPLEWKLHILSRRSPWLCWN